MELNRLKPRKALNKAFLKVKPNRAEIESFKANLIHLLDTINDTSSEEFHKNIVIDFLKKTYYDPNHFINTKNKTDLVIHNGAKPKSSVGVIVEAKKPTNKFEMVTNEKLNTKAFQELVLYYLRERITEKNLEVKHLIITNINEWFIFDATIFERLFAQNKSFVRQFRDFEDGRLADTRTDFFYKQIAEPFIANIRTEIEYTYFNFQDYQKPLRNDDKADDNKLIALYKLLSPEHLLKLPFTNDSNTLDKRFYSELLHIIGLSETKDRGKKIIERNKEGEQNTGSILENTIIQLDSLDKIRRLENPGQYGNNQQEKLFNVGLELTITWINRILFLKLLEAQLITYHRGDKSYSFLNMNKILNYDDLNGLFFQVLARRSEERNPDVKKIFEKVPYLNSSLFEPTEIEQVTLFISNLKDDKTIPIISSTVLKDANGKKRTGTISTLEYLFEFLNAYDFSSEGSEQIQEENKTLINASVLGLIFEKINGYKDGSFFTPGFITMYMCRETIRKAVIQKFNETKNWKCRDIHGLYDKIEDRTEANHIINSLKICDPAVGSGHFLVSALNEMIAVKNDLKILQDREGMRLKEYHVEVVNDELIVTDENDELFDYNPTNKESQRVQEALFHEKQTIIENCLFGVDINPNSVKICRLRLWIELLKNAYYKNTTELETLPNIDINIKCGNSLISRFGIDASLTKALRKSKFTIDSYRLAVSTYRNAQTKEEKHEMERLIAGIKSDFETTIETPFIKKLSKARGAVEKLATEINTRRQWGEATKALTKDLDKASKKLKTLEATRTEVENNKIFENAFEWRFEFPEVLNDQGDFVGFDVVIGNPPYIRQEELGDIKPYLQEHYKTYAGTADLYVYFVERALTIMRTGAAFSYIIPNKWMRAGYGSALRSFLQNQRLTEIIDFGDLPVFEEATTYPCIMQMEKAPIADVFHAATVGALNYADGHDFTHHLSRFEVLAAELRPEGWSLAPKEVQQLLAKIRSKGVPLSEYVDGKIFYGIKTGLNEAFVIDQATRDRLIAEDPRSGEVIKPFLAGRDIKRYKQPESEKYLILFKSGDTRKWFGENLSEAEAKEKMRAVFPAIMSWLEAFEAKAKKRYDKGHYWWELRACDYYDEFEKGKIIIPAIAKSANYAYDIKKNYSNDKTTIIPLSDFNLLGQLNSKLVDFYFKTIASTKQNGYYEYKPVYINQLPILPDSQPQMSGGAEDMLAAYGDDDKGTINGLEFITDRALYELYGLTNNEIFLIEN